MLFAWAGVIPPSMLSPVKNFIASDSSYTSSGADTSPLYNLGKIPEDTISAFNFGDFCASMISFVVIVLG